MKTTALLLALVWFDVNGLRAQGVQTKPTPPGATDGSMGYEEVGRDAHSRLWARVSYATNALGEVTASTNTFLEVQTGLHYRVGDQWLPSEAKIEILPSNAGAAAAKGPHKVIFPTEIQPGLSLIELATLDNQWLRSRIWGLSYFDAATGESVLLAEVKASVGQLLGDQTVLYPDAFTDFRADIKFTYLLAGFEQEIVLREQPPAPETFGMSSKSTRLQVLTEFVDAPTPAKESRQASGLADEFLGFGQMSIGAGRAFTMDAVGDPTGQVPVAKEWAPLSGRNFLIEEVPYAAVADQLQQLPAAGEYKGASLQRRGHGANVIAALKKLLPQRYVKSAPKPGTKRMAQAPPKSAPGFVMDYVLLTSQTNFTFAGNTNYYVSGLVNLSGTTIIEGGSILKFTNSSSAKVSVGGAGLVCQTGQYRPALFTSKDDNTVGETISGSTGSPTNTGATFLEVTAGTNALKALRFSYAGTALAQSYAPRPVWHCQFLKCGVAMSDNPMASSGIQELHNVLLAQCSLGLLPASGTVISVQGEHVTADQIGQWWIGGGSPVNTLTNSILTSLGNLGAALTMVNSFQFGSAAGVFATVGAGSYYLVAGSTNRNTGTPNLNATLANDLQNRTTYPPIELTNNFTVDTVLAPQAQRDTDLPDLGYHYDPLDYVVSGRTLTNATLTLVNGVALATYGAAGSSGIDLRAGARIVSLGSPTGLNWIVRYNTVQEQANTNWSASTVAPAIAFTVASTPEPQAQFTFTGWSVLGNTGNHLSGAKSIVTPFGFKDCQLGGGGFVTDDISVALTNCLWERVALNLDENKKDPDRFLFNNLFRGGSVSLANGGAATWILKDNLFDQTTLTGQSGGITHSHNAYLSGGNRLTPTNANDVVLTNRPVYQTSYLGRYYYPTDDGMLSLLVNAGSRNATNAGLYHYTTTTNQLKEASSIVDIGYHYVAVDTNGEPVDSDGGGVADYREDANGNGIVNTGETDWTNGHASDDDLTGVYGSILVPRYLRCEYRQNPLGVETNYGPPRLYWTVTSGRRAQKQTVYRVLVASSEANLNAGSGDMWDSGRVASDKTIHVEYGKNNLASGQRLWWKVRSWDAYGLPSPWSTNAFFQMGLLSANDWNGANWIGVTGYQSANPCPMFRSTNIVLAKPIASATAYVSAKGVYELWINGYRVGPNILAPEWTDYNVRIQYQTFDVSAYLTNGTSYSSNIIGAFVGKGWCYGPTTGNGFYGSQNPQFLLRLNITNTDGTTTNIYTDSNWKCSTNGPIRTASIFAGETYDARQEGATTNWGTASYTPVSFTNSVTPNAADASKLFAQPNDPIQIVQYLQPIAMWAIANSDGTIATVYDLGQNMVGWCLLSLTNVANLWGTNVTLQHGEGLIPDANNNGAFGPNNHAHAYLDNLAFAKPQQESYYLTNLANQQFHPHFTYHGFRYVEVTAPPAVANNLSLASLTGCVIRSGMPVTGAFWCSDTRKCAYATNLVSKLMTNASWGIRGNLQGVLTACTQRHEREGYLYDTMSQAACFDVDMGAFLTKWLRDIRETQRLRTPDHDYTDYAPWDGLGIGTAYFDPGAQGSALVYPWRLYQNYGDTRMLAEQYPSVANHIAYLIAKCDGSTWSTTNWDLNVPVQDWGSGDYFRWSGVPTTHPYGWPEGHAAGAMWRTWGTAWSAGAVDLAAKMASVLKLEAQARNDSASAAAYATDQVNFTSVAAKVRAAYINDLVRFDGSGINITSIWSSLPYNPPLYNGSWSSAQSDIMTALYFDMVPDSNRSNLVWLLINGPYGIANYNSGYTSDGINTNIVCTNHLSTGYYFAPRTLLELTRAGHTRKAYELLMDTNFPSFLYPVINGATTFWEAWNSYLSGPQYPGKPHNDRGYYPAGTTYEPWIVFSSLNHGSFEEVAAWIWGVVGGINPDNANPGFRNVIIKPEPGGGLTNTFASFISIHGPVVCTWTNNLSTTKYTLNFTNPANITATVYIPSTNNLPGILESGQPATSSPGVVSYYFTNWPSWTNGATVFQVGSGGYSFSVTNVSF